MYSYNVCARDFGPFVGNVHVLRQSTHFISILFFLPLLDDSFKFNNENKHMCGKNVSRIDVGHECAYVSVIAILVAMLNRLAFAIYRICQEAS